MRGYELDWRLFLKILAGSAFISGAVASLFLYPVKDAGHVAAWVQAVGTISAIVGAIYISKREQEARRKEAKDDACKKDMIIIRGMYSVAEDAFLHLKRFQTSVNRSPGFREEDNRSCRVLAWKMQGKLDLRQAIELLSNIPLYQSPSSALITGIAFFKSNLVALQSEIEEAVLRAMEDPSDKFPIHHILDLRLLDAYKIWDLLEKNLELYLDEIASAMTE